MPAHLFQATSVTEQTDQVALPWLREQGGLAWQGEKPTVVLVQSRTEGFYLRERMLSEKKGLLGVHFWTPSDARKFLLSKSDLTLTPASQTELRLMARTCAERLQKENPEERFFTGMVREPAEFLRSYDLLVSTGWDAVADNRPENRQLAREFSHRLRQVGRGTQAEIHRHLLQGEKSKRIARLLIVGFNATHWPLWDLLRATVQRAEQVTCSLLAPHVFAEKIDQLWISSWEMELKTTVQLLSPQLEAGVFSPLAQAYERADLNGRADQDVTFLVARDVQTHASAVVRQALVYIQQKECTRLGILFPEADALALEVAEQFRQLGVPIDEGTGFLYRMFFRPAPGRPGSSCRANGRRLPSLPGRVRWKRKALFFLSPPGRSRANWMPRGARRWWKTSIFLSPGWKKKRTRTRGNWCKCYGSKSGCPVRSS